MTNAKITVDTKELHDAVKMTKLSIERRAAVPILCLMRMTVFRGDLRLQGTNLDQHITTHIAGSGKGDFDIMFQPNNMLRFLNCLSGEVSISVKADYLTLKVGRDVLTVYLGIDASDQPELKVGPPVERVSIPEAELHRLLRRVRTCISAVMTRFYLNSVYFHSIDGKLALAATDGHRLMRVKTGFAWTGDGFILPASTVKILLAMLDKKGNGSVDIALHKDNKVTFKTKHGILRSKTIDCKFPDVQKLIPKPSNKISVDLDISCLRKFDAKTIKINPESGTITQSIDFDGSQVTAGVKVGVGASFGLNNALLKPLVAELGPVNISGNGATDPFLITGTDQDTTCALMPIKFN